MTSPYEQVVGSLCSGYGGLDLGLELALGVPVRHAWHVEYDKHPSAILAARFPSVPNYGDLTNLDHDALEPVDWLTAGYPCQPFSHAGKRKGASDERHLWPSVADTIGTLRPRGVLLENVAGHVSLGLDAVLWDLAALGYDATWGVVRAADAGAPHSRARVFILAADADPAAQRRRRSEGQQRGLGAAGLLADASGDATGDDERNEPQPRGSGPRRAQESPGGAGGPVADASCVGRDEGRGAGPAKADRRRSSADLAGRRDAPAPDAPRDGRDEGWTEPAGQLRGPDAAERGLPAAPDADIPSGQALIGRSGSGDARRLQPVVTGDPAGDIQWGAYAPAITRWEHITGRRAPRPTEPGRVGERLSPLFVEWLMGLPAGWVTDVPGLARNAQLKALGNGVVPQQAALAVKLLQPAHNAIGDVA